MAQVIDAKSVENAEAWKDRVEQLNQETADLLINVGTTLVNVREAADATFVDEIAEYGQKIISGTQEVKNGLDKMCTGIKTWINLITQAIDTGKTIVRGFATGIE